MVTAATRRDARERAIELLYESESKSIDVVSVLDALPLSPDPYAFELAVGVTDHRIELDHLLGRYAKRWNVDRMAVTDRTVLRLGAFELATQGDVPRGAALNEAVELASQYGSTDDTSKFVNGILANVANEVRGDDRPWGPIDAVVFDMDGVIRHWDETFITDAETAWDLKPGTIASVAFASPAFAEAMTGEITVEEWSASIGASLAHQHGVDAVDGAAMWMASTWTIDTAVVDLIRAVRAQGVATALFSNASTKLEADLDEMGIAPLFDVVVNSARIGLAKPDVAAFEHVAGMLAIDPSRLLFVDDRPENVVGALDAGWHGVQMVNADRLAGVLTRLGVLDAAQAT